MSKIKGSGLPLRFLDGLFDFFASLKLAVFVLLSFAGSLAVATFLESLYDTKTAQFYVYRSTWFFSLLGLLGINIFFAAMSRYPWKPRHASFILAHIGILMMLGGSWVTHRYGLDGSMRLSEGETAGVVETDQLQLLVSERDKVYSFPIEWRPPSSSFEPFRLKVAQLPSELKVDQFLSHADAIFSFVPNPQPISGLAPKPAAQVTIAGGPMKITQDFWLWAGDASFSSVQAGPARLMLIPASAAASIKADGKRNLILSPLEKGGVRYRAFSSDGKVVEGTFSAGNAEGKSLDPGWKGVSITLKKWLPDAVPNTEYQVSRMLYGPQAPPSAIHVTAGSGGKGSEVWLGLGDRAVLKVADRTIDIGFFPGRVVLPFSMNLGHFSIENYEGSVNPMSYASKVTVVDNPTAGIAPPADTMISMNEPLEYKGITFYQASYEDAQPRPVTSIFSVNRDPGRWIKYVGSLLIVFGTILLFFRKYKAWETLVGFFKRESK